MKAIARTLAAVAATALVSIALAGAALAADPSPQPMVGGTLSAGGRTIHVLSNGNVPAHVRLSATDVTLSTSEFDLQPGETHDVTFTGPKATGTVSALYSVIPVNGSESGTALLTLSLAPAHVPTPPFGFADLMPGGSVPFVWIALLILAFLLPARWFRRNVRIVRKRA